MKSVKQTMDPLRRLAYDRAKWNNFVVALNTGSGRFRCDMIINICDGN